MNKREGLFHIVQLHELGVESHCIIELRPVFQMDSCSSSVVDAIDLIKKIKSSCSEDQSYLQILQDCGGDKIFLIFCEFVLHVIRLPSLKPEQNWKPL
jgi:hypothetical protein